VGYEKYAVLHFGNNNLRNSYTLDPYRTHIRNRIWRIEWYHPPMAIESARNRRRNSLNSAQRLTCRAILVSAEFLDISFISSHLI